MLDFFNYPIIACAVLSLVFSGTCLWRIAREYHAFGKKWDELSEEYNNLQALDDEVRKQIKDKVEEIGMTLKKEVEKYYKENLSRGGKYREFKTPSKTFDADIVRILQVLPDGNCLAALINHDYEEDQDEGQVAYLLLKDGEKYRFYDEQELEVKEDTVIFQTGIFQYRAVSGCMQKTIPAVHIIGLEEME